MDTKIKALILLLFSAFTTFAQTPGINFAAKFNITSATGGDPYNITGIVLDDLSRFTGSDVQVNDSIYVIDGDQLYVLAVTSITSVVGPTVTLVANDPNNAGVSIPTGQAAICRPTDNYKLPLYISGLRDDLRSMVMNRQAQLIDDINGSAVSAITDFTSAGVNVPPSPAASLNGGETWRNMTTGELWGSDGNVWYPYTRGPKECQDTVLVSAITVQSGGSVTTGSPLIRNSSGVWEHMYNHPSGLNLIPDGVVTDIIVGGKAIIQYCGVRKGSGATPNTSYYVNQSISTGFTTTKPTTNIRPLGKVASNGDFLINAGLLFSRDNNLNVRDSTFAKISGSYANKRITDNIYKNGTLGIQTTDTTGVLNTIISPSAKRNNAVFNYNNAAAGAYLIKFKPQSQPDNSGLGSFNFTASNIEGANLPYSTRANHVWMIGYNQGAGGGKEVATDANLHIAFESNFHLGGGGVGLPVGKRVYEFHIQAGDTVSTTAHRIMTAIGAHDGSAGNVGFNSDGLYLSSYNNTAHPWLQTDRFSKTFNFLDSNVVFFHKNNGGGGIQQRNAANSSFLNLLFADNSDRVVVGGSGVTATYMPHGKLQLGGIGEIYNSSGNIITIGTSAAPCRLDVNSNGSEVFRLKSVSGGSSAWSSYIYSNNIEHTNSSGNPYLTVYSGSVTQIISANNKIGIGGVIGNGKLTIKQSSNGLADGLQLENAAGDHDWYWVTDVSGNLKITNTTGAERFSYTQAGDFGFGPTGSSRKVLRTTVSAPNTNVTGSRGDLSLYEDGSFGSLWVKITGSATNTGWEKVLTTSGTSGSVTTLMREESFTATAAQTAFTIAYSAPAVSGTSVPIRVYRNGVRLFYVASGPTITQFTYSGTTVTTAANTTGDIITIEYLN